MGFLVSAKKGGKALQIWLQSKSPPHFYAWSSSLCLQNYLSFVYMIKSDFFFKTQPKGQQPLL